MKRSQVGITRGAALMTALISIGSFAAQAQTVVPTAGQTPEQIGADRTACDTQAAAQSGYHPSQPGPTVTRNQPAVGQRLAGAARGAARGAVREQTTDKNEREIEDPTEAGARAGAAAGGVRQRQGRRETRREAAQQERTYAQKQTAYKQAFTAWARGYTIQ
jgi:hypothetical protein